MGVQVALNVRVNDVRVHARDASGRLKVTADDP